MNDVERVREGYDAFGRGDLDTIRGHMSPDVVWHVPGRSVLAGDYRGIDAVFGYFDQIFERSGGTFKADLIESGEIAPGLVACLVHLTGDMTAASIDQKVMQLFRREKDRTFEVWNFAQDQYALDEAEGPVAISLPDARKAEQPTAVTT
jgi:ketosteroid isomerase-like protein